MSAGPAATPGPAALAVADLRVTYGGVHAVDGATFEVPEGRLTGLIGPNGAGKSTVLAVIAGGRRPSGGRVVLNGQDIAGWPAHRVARRGVIRTFQLSSEFAHLTVLENLIVAAPEQRGAGFGGALLGKRYWRAQQAQIVARADRLLDEFQLGPSRNLYAGELSGGQKRLVEIMRGLMAGPSLLLLDEPLAGVNPSLRLVVESHLIRLRDQGLTMIMVEHELPTVERCCDSVVVMARGRVLAEGSMAQLRKDQEVIDAYLVG
ncbi:MAG: branched-chain amino acid transport system ATP-binding protein [Micromonosporaceae bacterium]